MAPPRALAESDSADTSRNESCYSNGEDTGRERAALAGSLAVQGCEETPCDTRWGEIRLRVSLRHLSLASSHFGRMFQDDWLEGKTLRSTALSKYLFKQMILLLCLSDWLISRNSHNSLFWLIITSHTKLWKYSRTCGSMD